MSNLNNNHLYQAQATQTAAQRAANMRKAFSMVGVFTLMLMLFTVGSKVSFSDPMTLMIAPFFVAVYMVAVRRVMQLGEFDVTKD